MKKSILITTSLVIIVSLFCMAGKNKKEEKQKIAVTEICSKFEVIGRLGVPVGMGVKIKGYKKGKGPLQNYFLVEEINGVKIDRVIGVEINGIEKWKDNTQATLLGEEVGTIAYLHPYQTNIAPVDIFTPYQTIFLKFKVYQIISPKGLKLADI